MGKMPKTPTCDEQPSNPLFELNCLILFHADTLSIVGSRTAPGDDPFDKPDKPKRITALSSLG
jgi:hypothetical protein